MRLSERQSEILAFITQYIRQHGVSPTRAEVRQGVGCANGVAQRNIAALVQRGFLAKSYGWRSLSLPKEVSA